jgi:MFS family permease
MKSLTGNTRAQLGVAVACVAQFVVVLDATIVTTALPSIASGLSLSTTQVQWVLTAYTLVFGGFLISGGRVADLLGARTAFLAGLALFVGASAACGLATSGAMLIGARVLQGLGAALLSPAALALLVTLTEEGQARRTAIGVWTATAAIGGASGWVLGGLLTQYWGWPAVFWLNLPIGIVALVVAPRLLPRIRAAGGRRLDLVGAAGLTLALGCLSYGLADASGRGLTSALTLAPLGVAGVLLVATLRYEAWHPAPLLPGRLLSSRPLMVGGLTAALLTGTTSPAMLLSVLYARHVVGHSPAGAALLFPAFNVGVIGGSLLSPRLIRRWETRVPLVAGFGIVLVGVMVLVALPDQVTSRAGSDLQLILAFVATGFGLGVASVASTQVGTEFVPTADRGVGAGILNAAAQVGAALGMACLLPLASSDSAAGGSYRIGYLACGGVAVVGAAVGFMAPRSPRASRHGVRETTVVQG